MYSLKSYEDVGKCPDGPQTRGATMQVLAALREERSLPEEDLATLGLEALGCVMARRSGRFHRALFSRAR